MLGIVHDGSPNNELAFIFVVGGPQYRVGSHRMFVTLARNLAAAGPAVLRFDCRGMGDSDGVFASFESISVDIRAAIDEIAARMPKRRVAVLGLCDGASACAVYAAHDPRIDCLVLMNPWVHSVSAEAKARVSHYYRSRFRQWGFWKKFLTGQVNLRSAFTSLIRNVLTAQSRADDQTPNFVDRMLKGLTMFSGRVMFILSSDDLTAQEFTTLTRTSDAWRAVMGRRTVTTESFEGADHTFSGPDDLERVTSRISEFVSRLSRT